MSDQNQTTDPAVTLTAIEQFRKFLDVMEEFIRDTEAEKQREQGDGQ